MINREIKSELHELELHIEHVVELLASENSIKRQKLYKKLRTIQANLAHALNEFESI